MSAGARTALGTRGEAIVAARLEREGFQIVGANVRVGRLELDLIARRDGLLVFCEVRTRASRAFVDPIETIDRNKQLRVRRAAAQWLQTHGGLGCEIRFDAASVVLDAEGPTLTYYEDAF